MNIRVPLITTLMTGSALAQMPMGVSPYVQVDKVTTGKDQVTRRSIGRTEAIRTVRVSSAVEGFLMEPHFKEGAMVKKGDILFEINPIRYKAAVQQTEASLDELKALILHADARCRRLQSLQQSNAASKEETETAKATLAELRAREAEAEANLVKARKDLSDCTIRAEISGRVGRMNFTEGNYITPGETLVTIQQMDPIYVRFPLSQSDVNGIFHGPKRIAEVARPQLITATGRSYPHDGIIRIVDTALAANTDSYNLWAEFPNKDNVLTPQGIGAMTITLTDTAIVTMVPLTAVQYDANGSFVYVVDKDNRVQRRDVIAGNVQGRMQSIYSGLEEGEVVISDGSHKTRVGSTVIPAFTSNADTKTVKGNTMPQEDTPVSVKTDKTILESDTTVLTCASAQVEAINKVQIRPLVQGLLIEQAVQDGDMVDRGDVIFRIDTTRYEAAVNAEKARIAQLDIRIADAKSKYERQEQLIKGNASSAEERDSAKATLDELIAQKSSAEAALIIAEDDLSRCTMRAPFNSRIGRVSIAQGNYITDTKTALTTLYQHSPVYVRFSLSENEVLSHFGSDDNLLKLADISLVTANGNLLKEEGQVSFSDNSITAETDTQNFWATFPNSEHQLRPGAVVTIRVTRKPESKVCSIPEQAILTDTRGRYVFIHRDGRAVLTRILCGTSTASGRIPVYSGLEEGDEVITTNLADLEDGSPVTIEH